MDASDREVIYHRLASEEYLSARRWYIEHASEDVANEFREEIDHAILKISADPQNWPIYHRSNRWAQLRRFPYLLVYRLLADDRVLIVAVAHTSRRPIYWQDRE